MAETTTRIYELQVKLATDSLAQLKKIQQSSFNLEKQFAKAGDAVKNFGASLLAGLSVGALIGMIDSTIAKVDDLGAAAQRIGMDAAGFSALTFAAAQSDASMEELEIGLKELQKSMVETSTKGAKVLDALGIDKSKPQLEVLKEFADKFKGIQDPALQTAALLEVFGKSGLKLRPLLEQGAAGIEALTTEAEKLGAVISDDVAAAFSDLDNEFKKTKATSEAMERGFVGALAPALTDIMQGLRDSAGGASAFEVAGKALGVMLRGLVTAGALVVHVFKQTGAVIYGVVAAALKLLSGDLAGASLEIESLDTRLKENSASFDAATDKYLGLADAADDAGDSIMSHTEAVVDSTAKVRKAMADADKDAKKTPFETISESLDDMLAALKRVDAELPKYEEAVDKAAKVLAKLNPLEREAVNLKLAEIEATEKLVKQRKLLDELTGTDAAKKYTDSIRELDDAFFSGRINLGKYETGMAKATGAMKSADAEAARLKQQMDRLNELTGKTAAAQWAEDVDLLDKEFFDNKGSLQAWQTGMEKVTGTANKAGKETNELFEKLADKIDGYAKSITDSLVDFATHADDAKFSFSDFASSVLRDLAKMATQILLVEPLMAGFKGWLKTVDLSGIGIPRPTGVAKGGVFTSPSLSRYSGGVYDSPQPFAFAKGGVFAEAGPEAVMPLTRGADGSLGVDASGAGVTVNVYNEARAQVETKSTTDVNGNRIIEIMVREAVSKGFRSGAFDGVMGATYGLNRQGAR